MTVKMPEPEVALYVQCANGMQMPVMSYSKAQVEAYAQAVRDEVLEEAAKMVDNCHPKASHKGIAAAIRTLKEQS